MSCAPGGSDNQLGRRAWYFRRACTLEQYNRVIARSLATKQSPTACHCEARSDDCPAGLLSIDFDASGDYLGPVSTSDNRELARFLAGQLSSCNVNDLCQ